MTESSGAVSPLEGCSADDENLGRVPGHCWAALQQLAEAGAGRHLHLEQQHRHVEFQRQLE